jgi:hypothetical protein
MVLIFSDEHILEWCGSTTSQKSNMQPLHAHFSSRRVVRVVFPAGWSFRGRHNSGLYGYIPNGLRHGNFFGGFSGSLERAATYLFV